MNIKLIKRIKFVIKRRKHNERMRQARYLVALKAVRIDRDTCRRIDEKLERNFRTFGLEYEPLFPDVHSPEPPPPPPPPLSPEENLRAMVKTLGEIRDILASRELD